MVDVAELVEVGWLLLTVDDGLTMFSHYYLLLLWLNYCLEFVGWLSI